MPAIVRAVAASAAAVSSPRPVAPGERPVDLVHLARQTLGDRTLEREVLRLFQRQSALLVQRLHRAEDPAVRGEIAHTLTGSARGIGAWRVAEAAERVGEGDSDLSFLEMEVTAANVYIADLLTTN